MTNHNKKTSQPAKNPYEQDAQKRQSLLDTFFGSTPGAREAYDKMQQSETDSSKEKKPNRREFTIFDGRVDFEQRTVPQQLKEISHEIKKELTVLKQRSAELATEVSEIEKHTIQSLPDKPGIYHVRFMELLLSFLRNISAKVTEAKTWLSAMQSKRAKRGSAFVARSKKKGTQYSMSQELQTARSVQ